MFNSYIDNCIMRGICFSQENKYNDKEKTKRKKIKEKYRKEKSNTNFFTYFAEEETS